MTPISKWIFLTILFISLQPAPTRALWLFETLANQTLDLSMFSSQAAGVLNQLPHSGSAKQIASSVEQKTTQAEPTYASYGTSLLSIAGIQPSSIASVLNTVGDTGFRYFNIQDQCRNRAACDLGAMLYKKLSFVHNWLIRTSVRTLTDMNNLYTQSWMEGMLGRNCSTVYSACSQSPLEGLMNLALLQHLAL